MTALAALPAARPPCGDPVADVTEEAAEADMEGSGGSGIRSATVSSSAGGGSPAPTHHPKEPAPERPLGVRLLDTRLLGVGTTAERLPAVRFTAEGLVRRGAVQVLALGAQGGHAVALPTTGASPADLATAPSVAALHQPVGQHPVAALGQHRLGVELHALDRQFAVPQRP